MVAPVSVWVPVVNVILPEFGVKVPVLEKSPETFKLVVPDNSKVPEVMVTDPVFELFPESNNLLVLEFCIIPVTLLPITAEMVVVPAPVLEFVIVPILLIEVLLSNIPLPDKSFKIILPVPTTPPDNSKAEAPLDGVVNVKLLFKAIKPLKVWLPLKSPELTILNVPLLPEVTVIGLAKVIAARLPPTNVALALPLVSPIVIVPAPPAFVLVCNRAVPALITKP